MARRTVVRAEAEEQTREKEKSKQEVVEEFRCKRRQPRGAREKQKEKDETKETAEK